MVRCMYSERRVVVTPAQQPTSARCYRARDCAGTPKREPQSIVASPVVEFDFDIERPVQVTNGQYDACEIVVVLTRKLFECYRTRVDAERLSSPSPDDGNRIQRRLSG
jgi:hypothetical protein